MKKRYWIPGLFLLILLVTYFTGPVIPEPVYATDLPRIDGPVNTLGKQVLAREDTEPLRADNGARILYAGDRGERTEYAIVYLHGFGASYRDAYPLNVAVADPLDANLYLGRWGNHGQQPPHHLKDFSPEMAWADAREALAYGKRLGNKVIVMSTSTGGTLGLKLAAEFPNDVYALINLSPNVKDDMPGAWLLNSPWGHELARLTALGGNDRKIRYEEPWADQYFDTLVPTDALVNLQILVSSTMTENTFSRITCPVLTLYYYEDWLHEDERVEVDVYPDMHAQLATPKNQQLLRALPTPGTHFLGSDIMSKDVPAARAAVLEWCRGVLEIPTVVDSGVTPQLHWGLR